MFKLLPGAKCSEHFYSFPDTYLLSGQNLGIEYYTGARANFDCSSFVKVTKNKLNILNEGN